MTTDELQLVDNLALLDVIEWLGTVKERAELLGYENAAHRFFVWQWKIANMFNGKTQLDELDGETTGVLSVALSKSGHAELAEQVRAS